MKCSINGCNREAEKKMLCQMHYRREWRKNNPEKDKITSDKAKDKQKKKIGHWRNKVKQCDVCKKSFIKTGPNQKYCSKKCQSKYHFKKKMQNPQHKLRHNLRSRLRKTIKGSKHGLSPVRHLGCGVSELRLYLESKWLPDMSWENYGLHGWHIDHIRPLSSFNLTIAEDFRMACHYTNLQPLWARDNLSKGRGVS